MERPPSLNRNKSMADPKAGTCSWKFESWVGLVYSRTFRTAAQYLIEYSRKYRTAEIDSWFYRMPDRQTVLDYLENVDEDFSFTCKLPMAISLTHHRKRKGETELRPNPGFLSQELFSEFLEAGEPMTGRLDAVMLQFEYLNRKKMPSLEHFIRSLESFVTGVPEEIPLAIETRNSNYLHGEYFDFLRESRIMHVFSEKIYMPHIYQVYEKHGDLLSGGSVIRLIGGDRKDIEKKTGKKWNRLVEPREDLEEIAAMVRDMVERGIEVTVNINNHYEGSAPLTIERFGRMLKKG
ncbi:MAG: DUF72 domain-containing protein [Candidatus Latescibacteria bacterium]|nr:DUF72 domain-containing protein [bacterium]MBD3423475.1 DUF72 domain-containing protein [Candidatus Latescibacterota bacterium]